MNEKLVKALDYVEDGYIAEAVKPQKKRRGLLVPIAAILALALLLTIPSMPATVSALEISTPTASRMEPGLYWRHSNEVLEESRSPLASFTSACSSRVLAGADNVNRIWSPMSAYISLSIAAELSEGTTRQELLDVLGAPDIDILRQRITAIWENMTTSGESGSISFTNSLWLDDSLTYDQGRMDDVSYHYYAPVLQQDLSGSAARRAVSNWVTNQTNGKLAYDGDLGSGGNSPLALISAIFLKSDWSREFDPKDNVIRTFHGNARDYPTTFMFQELYDHSYHWSDDFSATGLSLKNGAVMWLILPDEDKTLDQVLSSGVYMDLITSNGAFPEDNSTTIDIHLYLPKFRATGKVDLKPALMELGVQKVFDPAGGEFSGSLEGGLPIFIDGITQNNRVEINEYGVIATGYTEINWGAGANAPSSNYVEMVFDRPFLFAITYQAVPLFVGAINIA